MGYKVRTHVNGWCIVAEKEIFSRIKYLDETFDFYYADNDYAMTLKKHNIKHAIIYNSKVEHFDKSIAQEIKESHYDVFKFSDDNTKHLPSHLLTTEYAWLLKDKKSTSDHIKFHKKWGNPQILFRKNKLADLFIKMGFGFFNKFLM